MAITREEFERLALDQIDMLDRLARARTANAAEAEDLVQETYLRAIRSWASFELREHGIRAWLVRILYNTHLNSAAHESRQPRAMEDAALQAMPSPSDSGSEKWEANEDLNTAMHRLPAESRLVLNLWAIEEFSYQEMADALDIPIGTVMSRLHRARQQLKAALTSSGMRLGPKSAAPANEPES